MKAKRHSAPRPAPKPLAQRGRGKKLSLYLPTPILRELYSEAHRLDRSLSWVIQKAWTLGKGELRRQPVGRAQP